MKALLVPGQGSQKIGMGKQEYLDFPELADSASEILGYDIRYTTRTDSAKWLCYTEYAQPAIFVVNALRGRRLLLENKYHCAAGHSLGEIIALELMGAIDFDSALQLVKIRAEEMAKLDGGGLCVVIGLRESAIKDVLEDPELNGCFVANFNSSTQYVIAHPEGKAVKLKTLMLERGAHRAIPLQVSGAFHSPHMQSASDAFAERISHLEFRSPSVPVLRNIDGKPHTLKDMKANLSAQIMLPVRWVDCVREMVREGVDSYDETFGNALRRLVKSICSD